MQIFLSWSGERSKAAAQMFSSWLPQVIQAVDPWVSFDTNKGALWISELASVLEQSKVGIVFLTSDNMDAPWLLFEAGAISKTKDAKLCTFLLDIENPSDVKPPLGHFQYTIRTKEDIRKLLGTINKSVEQVGERAIAESTLDTVFERSWPVLNDALIKIAAEPSSAAPQPRPQHEILEELLEWARVQDRRMTADRLLSFGDLSRLATLGGGSLTITLPPTIASAIGTARGVGGVSGFSGTSGFSGFQPDAFQSGTSQMHPGLMVGGPEAGTEKSPLPLAAGKESDDKKSN